MTFVFIYGPPGVGKLTVAKALHKLAKYKIFHNQLTVDLVCSLFDFEDNTAAKLSSSIRLQLLEEAAKKKINLIMTFCYANPFDNAYIKKIQLLRKKYKTQLCFVQLSCTKKTLHKRITSKERRQFRKITSVKLLETIMSKYNLTSSIPFLKSYSIDTTAVPPRTIAKNIKTHFKL